ncbi:MAG TPA: four helix bundle protein [Thermoanaerobaculia bacterium]|nr:four helix bundle protein [Thermoanaerobaculia bacterium]
MSIRSYRDLRVWQKAVDLAVDSYRLSRRLPHSEIYGLSSQIQRSATSIPANIAEGHGRKHLGDYLHHLSMANGSLMELETHLMIAARLMFLNSDDLKPVFLQTADVGRMLNGLISKLQDSKRGLRP